MKQHFRFLLLIKPMCYISVFITAVAFSQKGSLDFLLTYVGETISALLRGYTKR